MIPQNREHFDKVMAAKTIPKSTAVAAPKVALSAEREQQLAEMNQRDETEKAILMDWGQHQVVTRKKII